MRGRCRGRWSIFNTETLVAQRIKEGADYEGIRVKFTGFLGKARVPMQLDIGFGDVVYPEPTEADYPTLLEGPAPRLCMYPRETVIAEKFQAMVFLGSVNSRMKDFYDTWLLSRQFSFDGPTLTKAIAKTFIHRKTDIDTDPVALTSAFTEAESTTKQWAALLKHAQLAYAPATLHEAASFLRTFLLPVAEAIASDHPFRLQWEPYGPWK